MNKVKIILVDDKKAYRNATKMLLNKIGNNEIIAEASSGEEFLDIIEKYSPDLVFMDIEMPGMNGIEATRKALQKYPDLLIIGLSLYDDKNYIKELINVGARGYLLKLSDNYAIIETILNHSGAEIFFSKEIDPRKPQKDKTKKSVLVVDDFESTRFIVGFTLQKEGFVVTKAASGEEAMKCFENNSFDIVVTDLNMPGMDGITLASKIRNIEGYENLPIILLTTSKNEDMKQRAKTAGITGWVQKPFEMNHFLSLIHKSLT